MTARYRRSVAACALLCCWGAHAHGQEAPIGEQIRKLEERVRELEGEIARMKDPLDQRPVVAVDAGSTTSSRPEKAPPVMPASIDDSEPFGRFTPGVGFTVARTDWGELQLSAYSYLRYLNQKGLDETFTDHFGDVRTIDIRDDFEINKLFLYTQGWFLDPRLRYVFYVWSSGPALGTPNSILSAGTITYTFNSALTVGGGVVALPSTRSMDGQFPRWDRVDARFIADEFMRGSFTQGIQASGRLSERLTYKVALGNNLNAFGVSAARLDSNMDSFAGALIWMPTTGEFGPRGSFGDFEHHEKLATLFSARYTSSTEDRESQPGLDSPENTQIRLSDGTIVFRADALAPGVTVERLDFDLVAMSAGMKYRGFYIEAEAYRRWLGNFRTAGVLQIDELTDDGMQVQASTMLIPATLQLYAGASKIWGEYGDPWDAAAGLNWWPWKKRGFRINGEVLRLEGSPVGSASLPYPVGGTGWVFTTNAELAF